MRAKSVMLFLLLSSCSPIVWERPGTGEYLFARDNLGCTLLAEQSLSLASASSPAAYLPLPNSTGGLIAALSLGILNNIAANLHERDIYAQCMIAQGYQEIPQ